MPAVRRTYQALLNEIAELYIATRASVAEMYWSIGKRIVEVEQGGAERAVYAGKLLPKLSADLTKRCGRGFSVDTLERMRRIYVQHPISAPARKLTWAHQVELLSLPPKLRQRLAAQASGQELTRDELRKLIQEARQRLKPRTSTDGKPPAPPQLLTPTRGTPGLFQMKTMNETRCIDWGFQAYRPLTATERRRFSDGQIVRRASGGMLTRLPKATVRDLYTYDAEGVRVVDGDTLWMVIHLTSTNWRYEKLRLRGIDCPERGTDDGDAATRYVQAQVQQATRVVIATTKPDKWDRYLSDVYLTIDGADVFLNNRLLELGHARRYEAISPQDWDG